MGFELSALREGARSDAESLESVGRAGVKYGLCDCKSGSLVGKPRILHHIRAGWMSHSDRLIARLMLRHSNEIKRQPDWTAEALAEASLELRLLAA